ncbi:degenerate transposase (orf2) [Streptococcus pneumoniae]|nr:degenerate transposase (orf2) [Streptococcus pneumoniae]
MTEFSLDLLLKAIKLARSTYYYHLKQLDKPDKDQELKAEIQSIFIEHKGNYAYRYMIKLIDRYGIEFVKKGKNRYYSPDLKQEMINKV